VTPAQFAVEKGTHTLVLRKQGYLDETTSTDLGPGQNFQFAPALRALGNADEIRSVGKFKKNLRAGGGRQRCRHGFDERSYPAQRRADCGQSTTPGKSVTHRVHAGAGQLRVGHHADWVLSPSTRFVTVEKGGKVAIDEILERQ